MSDAILPDTAGIIYLSGELIRASPTHTSIVISSPPPPRKTNDKTILSAHKANSGSTIFLEK